MDASKISRIVGITGTIGSGKSLVGKILEELGVPVIDSDNLVHQLLTNDTPTRKAVIERFGAAIQLPGGAVDRRALGAIVFEDANARRDLEKIVHPAAILECRRAVAALSGKPVVAILVPLLFEAGLASEYDEIWTVIADETVLRERLGKRDQATADQIDQRLSAQWSQERKAQSATAVIDNSGTAAGTKQQVERLLSKLELPA